MIDIGVLLKNGGIYNEEVAAWLNELGGKHASNFRKIQTAFAVGEACQIKFWKLSK